MNTPNTSPALTLADFYELVSYHSTLNLDWRYGQTLFNTLSIYRPDLAEMVRGTSADPFFSDDPDSTEVVKFFSLIVERW